MTVDDAGTLAAGDAKVEFGWRKDGATRGFDVLAGFSPRDFVEVGLGFARDRGDGVTAREAFAEVKWVPLQSEEGPSAGMKIEYARANVHAGDRPSRLAILALFTYAFEAGPRVHVNAGRDWSREGGERAHASLWGVGVDAPLGDAWEVALEIHGARHAGPDRAVGVRYRLTEGVKLSAAYGRGNDRSFANAGIAWEF